jgi:hypothetical protein
MSTTRLERAGVGVILPTGWEGSISGGDLKTLADGSIEPTLLHAGSFPLPAGRGSFGSGAVETMGAQDVFIAVIEYDQASADTPLFASQGIPRVLAAREFDRNILQRALPGHSGTQRFFTHEGRAFCLYVELGSHIDRADLLPVVNAVLATLQLS